MFDFFPYRLNRILNLPIANKFVRMKHDVHLTPELVSDNAIEINSFCEISRNYWIRVAHFGIKFLVFHAVASVKNIDKEYNNIMFNIPTKHKVKCSQLYRVQRNCIPVTLRAAAVKEPITSHLSHYLIVPILFKEAVCFCLWMCIEIGLNKD